MPDGVTVALRTLEPDGDFAVGVPRKPYFKPLRKIGFASVLGAIVNAVLVVWLALSPARAEAIEPGETPFYVSDSYTIQVHASAGSPHGAGFKVVHAAGVFNSSRTWSAGQPITASFAFGDFGLVALDGVWGQGVNADVQIGVYDITQNPAQLVAILGFQPPYGTAPNGLLMNVTAGGTDYGYSSRVLPERVTVGGVCPAASCQIGPVLTFFAARDVTVQYQYAMQGASR